MKLRIVIGLALVMCGVVSALAESPNGKQVTDIIRSLAPTVEPPTRAGFSNVATKRVLVQDVTIFVDMTHSLDFEVFFPFDRAEITAQARMQLEFLGEALVSPALREHSFLIGGHTDAKGSAAYNLELSSRRAASVRMFLLEHFAIEPARLIAAGFGESQLKNPASPTAGINRRVEVALILSREEY